MAKSQPTEAVTTAKPPPPAGQPDTRTPAEKRLWTMSQKNPPAPEDTQDPDTKSTPPVTVVNTADLPPPPPEQPPADQPPGDGTPKAEESDPLNPVHVCEICGGKDFEEVGKIGDHYYPQVLGCGTVISITHRHRVRCLACTKISVRKSYSK